MANIVYPVTLSNNTTADADQVMANFNAVTAQFNGNIDSSNLGNGIVTGAKIATDTITATNIASDAITQSELGPLSVGTPELIDNAVTNAKMADDSVGNAELQDNSVGNAEMKDAAVGTAELIDGSVTVAKLAGDASAVVVPTGTILTTARATAPTGYLICDGSTISRGGANAALFAAIGTAFGAGDGSTTFKIPDLRGRSPFGVDSTGAHMPYYKAFGLTDLGDAAGEDTHGLTVGEMPAHTHTVNNAIIAGVGNIIRHDGAGASGQINAVTTSTGSGNDHNNMTPYLICTFIIKL